MIEYKYIGFICNKVDYKDNDAIINILTSEGKKTFKARGINKITSKNSSSCNYFMLSEFVCSSKSETSNQTLKSSSVIKIYKDCYDDLLISSTYLCICSLLDQLSNDVNGYEIALKCFDLLEQKVYPINVLNYFLKILSTALGYKPNLSGCISCGKKDNLISFDFESGGFICSNCFNSSYHEKHSTNFLKALYDFYKVEDLLELDNLKAVKLFMMYIQFYKNVLLINNKSFDFIIKCL